MRIDLRLLAVVAAVGCLLTACPSTAPTRGFGPDLSGLSAPNSADAAWYLWMSEGDAQAAFDAFEERVAAGATDPWTLYGLAESAAATARYTRATEAYTQLLERHPGDESAPAAAAQLWALRNHAPGWRDRATRAAETTAKPAAGPSALTRGLLGRMAMEADYRKSRASADAGPFDGSAHGFANPWRVAGPLSVYPHLDRYTAFPADDDTALADSYPRRGFEEKTVDLVCDEPRCDPTWRQTGIHILETWLTVPAPIHTVLTLETRHDLLVEVDGEPVIDVQRQEGESSEHFARTVHLGAGTHRVRVRMAVTGQNDQFVLQWTARNGGRFPGTFAAKPAGAAMAKATSGDDDLFAEAIEAEPDSPWHAYVQATLAAFAGSTQDLVILTDTVSGNYPAFSGAPLARASGISTALGIDSGVAREGSLALLRRTFEQDPGSLAAADRLGWQLAEEGRAEEALEILVGVGELRPDEYLPQMHLYQAFDVLGWAAQSRATLRRAAKLNPTNCAVVLRLWNAWEAQAVWPEPTEVLTPEQLACDESQRMLALKYDLPAGRVEGAIARLETVAARNPRSIETRRSLAALYELSGKAEAADKQWALAADASADPVSIDLARFDLLLGRGQRDAARAWAGKALARNPGSYGLQRALAGLDGKNVLEDLRIDGAPIIRGFLAAPVGDDSSGVYVLDYAATRVFDDGSSITNTHIIIRVQNKDGIDAFGEVEIPSTALLLQVRTVKPDGTALEPDFVAGKASISMPNLEPGDFVEYEYLEASEGSTLRKGSYEGIRFYFNIFDAPLLRSEYILELPDSWKPEVDRRNGAPEPVVTTRQGFRRHRFLVERGPQVYGEPSAAPSGEFLPSIRVTAARDQRDVYRTWRDQVLGTTRPNWMMREAVDQTIGAARTEREKAELIWSLVFASVTGDDSGVFSRSAGETWSVGRGDRRVVLATLLQLAGIEAEMVFARPWNADNTPATVLSTETLQWVLLRAKVDGEWVWMDPTLNHAILGYIPSAVQGNTGLRLGDVPGDEPLFVDIPTLPSQADRRVVELDLEILPNGTVRGAVVETYNGDGAITFRRILDSYSDRGELERAVEQSMAQTFPGVDIKDLEFDHVDDADSALVMRYTLTAPDFAVPSDRGLRIDRPFFPSDLTASYAQLPSRRMTMVLGDRVRIDLALHLILPEGTTLASLPAPIDAKTPFGRVSRTAKQDGRGLVWKRSFVLEAPRVAASDYPAFQEFARVCDTADPLRLEVIPK